MANKQERIATLIRKNIAEIIQFAEEALEQKKPYAVGFPQHKASLVCYVVLGLRDANGDAQLSCHFQDQ